ncbi:TPA: hypothetical protein ACGJQN_003853, partial [Escherichia coli]
WSRYGQLLAFTDCSGYQTRYEYDRFGQMTAVHREEGISLYRYYDNRGRLTSVRCGPLPHAAPAWSAPDGTPARHRPSRR